MSTRKTISITALILAAALMLSAACISYAAPQAQNLELQTCRGVSVGGTLPASDPEGGPLVFQITTQPVKGSVVLGAGGEFVYTPADGKKGRDYFGYKAADAQGELSQEGTVVIRIDGKKPAVAYSDMEGRGEYYDAVLLAKNGIFTGEKVGCAYLFSPEREITRGEFLAMCMELSGEKLLSGVMSTGFADDVTIPVWEKSYVSTAAMNGMVCGYPAAGGAVFGAEQPVTQAEAAVMLSRAAGLTDVADIGGDEAVPTWAAQSVANLRSGSILGNGAAMSSALTRAQAAEMLVKALESLKAKK